VVVKTMNNEELFTLIETIPDGLKEKVKNFVDYLMYKHQARPKYIGKD
jgi:hypothetical protein